MALPSLCPVAIDSSVHDHGPMQCDVRDPGGFVMFPLRAALCGWLPGQYWMELDLKKLILGQIFLARLRIS